MCFVSYSKEYNCGKTKYTRTHTYIYIYIYIATWEEDNIPRTYSKEEMLILCLSQIQKLRGWIKQTRYWRILCIILIKDQG